MLFGKVNLPDSLLNAQRNETLVVFAGAGVSMGAPANYPSFAELAKQVNANKLELPIKKNEHGRNACDTRCEP